MGETNTSRGRKSEVSKLKEEINEMKEQQNLMFEQFRQILASMSGSMNVPPKEEVLVEKEEQKEDKPVVLDQPKSDELIRLCSLTHGELNLNLDGRPAISFRKYGDIKPVLYSKLVNVVNENRGFAECGDFYIMDERAVYHLGLSEYYKKIYPLEVLNNIETYSEDKIKDILSRMCRTQKETVVINIAQKMYDNASINQNSVKVIENSLGIDIHDMVKTMREIDENMK